MASEKDVTSDSLDVKVTKIPESLQRYAKRKVAEYITQSEDISVEIHHVSGQNAKLVLTVGADYGTGKQAVVGSENETNVKGNTRAISVLNLPANVDEDLLEVFFESKKKYGGGPVESVMIFEDRNAAIVKFCDESSVKTVLEKKPILFGKTELKVEPFREMLATTETITQVDIKGFDRTFTYDFIEKSLDYLLPLTLSGPEIAAKIKVCTRVVRGKDWRWGDQDGVGEGTVVKLTVFDRDYDVSVKWDKGGSTPCRYRMGKQGCYDLQLAP